MSPLYNAMFSTMGFCHRRDYLELTAGFFIVFFPTLSGFGNKFIPSVFQTFERWIFSVD
jgi:hypothetical protein